MQTPAGKTNILAFQVAGTASFALLEIKGRRHS